MTTLQLSHGRNTNIRRRKAWLADATLAVFIVALAGCQNAQRWSQPSTAPSDQYFAPTAVATSAPATSSAVATSIETGETKPWKSKIITTADDATAAPSKTAWTTTASVIKWSNDIGSPDRGAGAAGVDGGGGADR